MRIRGTSITAAILALGWTWLGAAPGPAASNTPMTLPDRRHRRLPGASRGGFGYSSYGAQGFIVKMDKTVVCHAPTGNLANKKTLDVSFPEGLATHLAHGDTIGQCGNGM